MNSWNVLKVSCIFAAQSEQSLTSTRIFSRDGPKRVIWEQHRSRRRLSDAGTFHRKTSEQEDKGLWCPQWVKTPKGVFVLYSELVRCKQHHGPRTGGVKAPSYLSQWRKLAAGSHHHVGLMERSPVHIWTLVTAAHGCEVQCNSALCQDQRTLSAQFVASFPVQLFLASDESVFGAHIIFKYWRLNLKLC